ncbi:MAG: glycoside hydrolase family 43 protein [Mycetocola sp.]
MKYPNPLISGFYPDPSVVKVGDEYFLATSTFEYLPGIPIFHSRDLVTWKQIGNVVDRPGQLHSENVPTLGGAWAPTIRFRDGVFYVVVTDAMARGMLIFTTGSPSGPWSDGLVVQDIHGIDPDLAWGDDGTAYITYSGLDTTSGNDPGEHGGILQITVDLETGIPTSEPRQLWSGTGLKFPEAPHLYQHGDYWYLLIAEGGTERGHGISVARGNSPAGPFADGAGQGGPTNPILSARSTGREIQNTGHGDLVETPDGGWALIMLGMRPGGMTQAFSALGRETFITEARWENDWLVAEPVLLNPRPGMVVHETDFDEAELSPEWISIRRFPTEVSSLSERPGWLTLSGDGSTLDDQRPVLVGWRQQHPWATASVVLDPGTGLGGLSVRFDEDHHYEIEVGGGQATARASVAGIRQTWTAPVPSGAVTLGIDFVPSDGEGILANLTSDIVVLSVGSGEDRVELARVDGRYLSQETAASFTGRVIGLYAVDGMVAFDSFRYTGKD